MARGLAAWLALVAACGFESPEVKPVDARVGFDPARDCPAGYTTELASTLATSRYRVIITAARFWPHNADCNDDLPGVTHAASLGGMQELLDLKRHVETLLLDRYYLGAVQDPQATMPGQGWISFDGTPLLQTAWYTQGNEPNDDGGLENQDQQLLILDRVQTYLQDAVGTSTYGIVCECDGTPIAAMAQDFIDRDPNNSS